MNGRGFRYDASTFDITTVKNKSPMERLCNIVRCIYWDQFWKEFDELIKRECEGCKTYHDDDMYMEYYERQDQHEREHDLCMDPEKDGE